MLSRVAETLYWTARYIERAESLARLINVNNLLLMDLPKGTSPGWEPLIDIIGSREHFNSVHDDVTEKTVLHYLTIDPDSPSSLLSSLKNARDNARTVRDVMPRELWEAINRLYMETGEAGSGFLSKRGRFGCLKQVINQSLMIFGMIDSTMNHDQGYLFWSFGSTLERADMTSRIIDVRSSVLADESRDVSFENIQWISVLRSMSGYQMYRQKMGVRVRPEDVLLFMLHSDQFPRSVLFSLNYLKTLVQRIPNNDTMKDRIDHSITELLEQEVAILKGNELHDYIDELQIDLADIHKQLAEQYFLH